MHTKGNVFHIYLIKSERSDYFYHVQGEGPAGRVGTPAGLLWVSVQDLSCGEKGHLVEKHQLSVI